MDYGWTARCRLQTLALELVAVDRGEQALDQILRDDGVAAADRDDRAAHRLVAVDRRPRAASRPPARRARPCTGGTRSRARARPSSSSRRRCRAPSPRAGRRPPRGRTRSSGRSSSRCGRRGSAARRPSSPTAIDGCSREAVARVDDEHDLVLVQREARHGRMRQVADEADLHLLAEHELEDLLRVARADDQMDVRERRLEAAEDERQHVGRDRRRGADQELADAALAAARAGAARPRRATGRARCACGRKARPSAVSRIPRGVRTKSSTRARARDS